MELYNIIELSDNQAVALEIKLNKNNELGNKWRQLGDILYAWRANPNHYVISKPCRYNITKDQFNWVLENIENDSSDKFFKLITGENINPAENLINENKILRDTIIDHTRSIEIAKNQIKKNECQIWKMCPHQWERDYDCAFDERTKYYCVKCKLWRNSFLYNKC